MRKLCIYGSSGMGREIADLAKEIGEWDDILFVNDFITEKTIVNRIPVYTFEEIEEKFLFDDIEFIVALGEPLYREKIYKKLFESKCNITKIIAPNLLISDFTEIQNGSIIHKGATITCNVLIKQGCFLNKHVVVGHDVEIGEYTVVSPSVSIGGNVKIGSGVYIGTGAVIRDGIRIGNNAIIGMGSVVIKDVQESFVVVGNPATKLRENVTRIVF